jgi:hypothetical protein
MEMHRLEAPAESRKIQKAQRSGAPLRADKVQETVRRYDTKMPLPGTLDWKIYLALSEICEFAAVTEHPVGWRQSTGRMSRDVTAMMQATELISRWLSEKWPDLRKEVGHRRTYNLRTYLARRATENKHFSIALRYHAKACAARLAGLLERASLDFCCRFLPEMAGIKWSTPRQLVLAFGPHSHSENLQA